MNPILCGCYEEWMHLMSSMKIPRAIGERVYPFIGDPQKLLGLERHITVFRYGNWRSRKQKDLIAIEEMCRARCFNVIDLEEM